MVLKLSDDYSELYGCRGTKRRAYGRELRDERLWKLPLDRGMKCTDFWKDTGFCSSSIAKFRKHEKIMTQSVIRTLNTTDVELHNIAKTIPDEAASAGISMMLIEAEHVRITETCQAELSEPASRVFCRVV